MAKVRIRITRFDALAQRPPPPGTPPEHEPVGEHAPLIAAGSVAGAGLGGLESMLVLHDGLHRDPSVLAWLLASLGFSLLWRALVRADVARSPWALGGALLLGWAAFILVEGPLAHHLLATHHVRAEGELLQGDLIYLALGIAFAIIGALVLHRRRG